MPETGGRARKPALEFNLHREIYIPRIIGYALSLIILATSLWQQDSPWWTWVLVLVNCLAWPHAAFLISKRSRQPNQQELRNLVLDSFMGGFWSYYIMFNPVPTAVIYSMLLVNAMAVAGPRFFFLNILIFIAGGLILVPISGFHFNPETNMNTIISCLPLLLIFLPMNGLTAYLRTMQVKRVKTMLQEAQKVAARDMAMAVSVQLSVLPSALPQSDDWNLAYEFKPMLGVAGDFYDFYMFDGRLTGLGIFDVSGHGISSGLVTMLAKSMIFLAFKEKLSAPLGEVFTAANRELFHEIKNAHYYITGALLRFHENSVEYTSAAHPPVYLKSGDRVVTVLNERGELLDGILLGMDEREYPYETTSLELSPGDYLLLYTDGLTEQRNPSDEEYGTERMAEALARAPLGTAREVLDYLLDDMYRFVGRKNSFHDDLTAIVLKKK